MDNVLFREYFDYGSHLTAAESQVIDIGSTFVAQEQLIYSKWTFSYVLDIKY